MSLPISFTRALVKLNTNSLANALLDERARRNITQVQAAKQIGISLSTLRKLEHRDKRNLQTNTYLNVCQWLNVKTDYFLYYNI